MLTLKDYKKSPELVKELIDSLRKNIHEQTIKQSLFSNDCLPAVASMITNTPIQEIKKYIKNKTGNTGEKGYYEYEIYGFLLDKGYILGLYIKNPQEHDIVESKICIDVYMNQPAILITEAECECQHHAIYWNGISIKDPLPTITKPRDLNDYKISKWLPVSKL